jgi:hypothetical protein
VLQGLWPSGACGSIAATRKYTFDPDGDAADGVSVNFTLEHGMLGEMLAGVAVSVAC